MNILIVPLSFPLVAFISMAVHELGHAAAALALGYKIVEIRFGTGRPFLRREIGQVSVAVGRDFIQGLVTAIPPVPNRAIASFLFSAAGPLADIALIFVFIGISRHLAKLFILT